MVSYRTRKVSGTLTDHDIYTIAYEKGKNVLLEGSTGEGKSMSVRSWCQAHNLPLYEVNFAFGVDSQHVIGGWYPNEKGGFRWEDGLATQAFLEEDGAVLFLDEINRVPPAVSAHLHTVLDTQRSITLAEYHGEIITPKSNVLIVAAMNPVNSSYQGAMHLDEALRRRFPYQIDWTVDNAILESVVANDNVIKMAIALRNSPQAQRFVTPLSTASFVELDQAINDVDMETAVQFFINRFKADERPEVEEFTKLYLTEQRALATRESRRQTRTTSTSRAVRKRMAP